MSDNIHKHFFDRSLQKKISRYAHPHTGLRRLCVDFGVNNILKWTLERNVNLNLQPSRVRAGDFLQAWGGADRVISSHISGGADRPRNVLHSSSLMVSELTPPAHHHPPPPHTASAHTKEAKPFIDPSLWSPLASVTTFAEKKKQNTKDKNL